MSNDSPTHARILSAARTLLEQGAVDVSMGDIARAAGVSRQLLYHHFDGRADLLLAMARQVDAAARPATEQAEVDRAPSAVTALARAVTLQARIKPRIAAITVAIDRLRATDEAAQAAWAEREQARLDRARGVVHRLREESLLAPGWDVDSGARLLWSMTSQRAWTELVVEAGWSSGQWADHTTVALTRALTCRDAPRTSAA